MIEKLVLGRIYAIMNSSILTLTKGVYLGMSYSRLLLPHTILFKEEDDLYIKKFKNYGLENKSKLWVNDFVSEEININKLNLFEREYLHKLAEDKKLE
ncbi:MAG: hypothetical protein QT10_C0001G0014 [archaeon GW2011_AR19]|nr:MAG: hypothetical protein QT10_C0001G0014 [archaeon GW2011_AR19]